MARPCCTVQPSSIRSCVQSSESAIVLHARARKVRSTNCKFGFLGAWTRALNGLTLEGIPADRVDHLVFVATLSGDVNQLGERWLHLGEAFVRPAGLARRVGAGAGRVGAGRAASAGRAGHAGRRRTGAGGAGRAGAGRTGWPTMQWLPVLGGRAPGQASEQQQQKSCTIGRHHSDELAFPMFV